MVNLIEEKGIAVSSQGNATQEKKFIAEKMREAMDMMKWTALVKYPRESYDTELNRHAALGSRPEFVGRQFRMI